MIRGTENINSNTPIVAVTSYALDAVDHNLFDAVIEKPVSPSRLTSEIENLCYWKPPPPATKSVDTNAEGTVYTTTDGEGRYPVYSVT